MAEGPPEPDARAVPQGLRVRLAPPVAASPLLRRPSCWRSPAPAGAATYYSGADWDHVEDTLAAFDKRPPTVPCVYLLGGSAARESITSEPGWTAQIRAMGGGKVRALDFGSSSQSFKNDLKIVNAMPAVPTIVLIGLNVGRYTSIPPATPASAARGLRGGVYDPHRFHVGQQLSDAAKRGIVRQWLAVKYPRFRQRYAGNNATLRALIVLCQERGFYPVLVELPPTCTSSATPGTGPATATGAERAPPPRTSASPTRTSSRASGSSAATSSTSPTWSSRAGPSTSAGSPGSSSPSSSSTASPPNDHVVEP